MVFWTSKESHDAWSHDSLHIAMAVNIAEEEIAAASTANWRVALAISWSSSIIA